MDCERVVANIRRELKDYVKKNDLKSLILGISSGIDSTVVCLILKPVCDQLNIPLIGRSVSIESDKESEILSDKIGKYFCTDYKRIDLTNVYITMRGSFDSIEGVSDNELKNRIRNGNMKSRIRANFFYHDAHLFNGMVIGTDQLSESAHMGCSFFTIGGDGLFDYGPIQNLWKTEVYEIAKFIDYNELKNDQEKLALRESISKEPSDGLDVTDEGTDLSQLGANSYDEVDSILQRYHELNELNGIFIEDHSTQMEFTRLKEHPVIKRHRAGKFKANLPVTIPRDVLFR